MAKPPPPPPAPIAGKKRGRPSWDDRAPPSLKSDSVNAKVAKTIKDNYNLDHILDAAKLALKQSGYKDASKVIDLVQRDPFENGENALKSLSFQGKTLSCSSTVGLVCL